MMHWCGWHKTEVRRVGDDIVCVCVCFSCCGAELCHFSTADNRNSKRSETSVFLPISDSRALVTGEQRRCHRAPTGPKYWSRVCPFSDMKQRPVGLQTSDYRLDSLRRLFGFHRHRPYRAKLDKRLTSSRRTKNKEQTSDDIWCFIKKTFYKQSTHVYPNSDWVTARVN